MSKRLYGRRRSSPPKLQLVAALETPATASAVDPRKRIPKACDRCRAKKVKCDGSAPCKRCELENAVCYFGARGKTDDQPVSATVVHQLQWQNHFLTEALRVLWNRAAGGGQDDPSVTAPSGDELSIHTIVESTGVLRKARDPSRALPGVDLENLFDGPELLGTPTEPQPSQTRGRMPLVPDFPLAETYLGTHDINELNFDNPQDSIDPESTRTVNALLDDLGDVVLRDPAADLQDGVSTITWRHSFSGSSYGLNARGEAITPMVSMQPVSQQAQPNFNRQSIIQAPENDIFEDWTTLGDKTHDSDRALLVF